MEVKVAAPASAGDVDRKDVIAMSLDDSGSDERPMVKIRSHDMEEKDALEVSSALVCKFSHTLASIIDGDVERKLAVYELPGVTAAILKLYIVWLKEHDKGASGFAIPPDIPKVHSVFSCPSLMCMCVCVCVFIQPVPARDMKDCCGEKHQKCCAIWVDDMAENRVHLYESIKFAGYLQDEVFHVLVCAKVATQGQKCP